MLKYQITNTQDKRFYTCLPELVIYDIRTKETTLISSYAAKIIHLFNTVCKNQALLLADLTARFNQEDSFSIEFFEQSLEQLLQMNLIESIE